MEVKMNISIVDLLPKSVAMGTAMMLSQREKGIEKYGQPIEDAKLSALELVEHAAQEAADGLVYISELPAKVQALMDRIAELEGALIASNNDLMRAQGHLILIRDTYKRGCITGNMTELRDVVFVATKDLPPSKHEQVLRDVLRECESRHMGGPGDNLEVIHHIVTEALK